jgi:tetratricopeptide (TPR) repeat protein
MKTLVNTVKLLNAYKVKVVLMTFLVTSFTLPAYTQENLWHELIGKANTLQQQRQYPEAESVYEEALKVAEDTFGSDHLNVAISLNNLAGLYISKGNYAEIEPLYKRALEIVEKAHGPDHPDVAISLKNLAELYYNQGRYAEAEPLYKSSLKILEKVLGLDHPEVAIMLEHMAELYKKIGKEDEAE